VTGFRSWRRRFKADLWKRRGRVPDGSGSGAAKWLAIQEGIAGADGRYGWNDAGLDERVVEYAWLFDRIRSLKRGPVLDAGSVLNHRPILDAWRSANLPPVSIVTLGYEGHAEVSDDVRYEFADLRRLPYRDEWFPTVISLSTLEHVGLDNTVYGAAAGAASRGADANAEALKALAELQRVTARGGAVLVSVPYGARSNRGWFRIFDADDLSRLMSLPGWARQQVRYFHQTRDGWRECDASHVSNAGYNEPRNKPGQHTAPEWVAAAEAVALIEFTRA
jgi:hypothetical protein